MDSYNRQYDAEGNLLQEVYLYRTKYKGRPGHSGVQPGGHVGGLIAVGVTFGHLKAGPEDGHINTLR